MCARCRANWRSSRPPPQPLPPLTVASPPHGAAARRWRQRRHCCRDHSIPGDDNATCHRRTCRRTSLLPLPVAGCAPCRPTAPAARPPSVSKQWPCPPPPCPSQSRGRRLPTTHRRHFFQVAPRHGGGCGDDGARRPPGRCRTAGNRLGVPRPRRPPPSAGLPRGGRRAAAAAATGTSRFPAATDSGTAAGTHTGDAPPPPLPSAPPRAARRHPLPRRRHCRRRPPAAYPLLPGQALGGPRRRPTPTATARKPRCLRRPQPLWWPPQSLAAAAHRQPHPRRRAHTRHPRRLAA